MRERVFGPIGMTASTLDPAEAMRGGGFATPAAPTLTGDLRASPLRGEASFARAVLPAGGVWSNARDTARFVQTLLAGGVAPDGARVVSGAALAETWTPRVAIPSDPTLPPDAGAATRGYGRGWFVGEFAGRRVLGHSGGVSGFFSELALPPEAGLGVVVLTNGGVDARTYTLAVPTRRGELLLDRPPRVGPLVAAQAVATAARFAAARARLGTVDPAAVAPWRGRFANPRLGEAAIELRDGQLRFDAGEVRSEIRPRQDEAGGGVGYRFVDPPLAGLPVAPGFRRGAGGRPEVVVRVSGEGAPAFVFAPAGAAG